MTIPVLADAGPKGATARAPFFLIQAARPALRESPVRSVVKVSSSSGTPRRAGQPAYGGQVVDRE